METSMNVLFSVRKSKINRNRQLPIYIRVTIGGSRFETSTGKTVLEEKWSAGSGRIKGSSIEAREINVFLDYLIGKAHGIQRQIIQEGLVMSIEVFKNKWLGVDEKSVDLLNVFEDHNSKINDLVGIEYAYATYLRYQTTLGTHVNSFFGSSMLNRWMSGN